MHTEHTIESHTKSVRALLSETKYTIDIYQREYKWETRQISDLLQDLEAKFIENYNENHERTQVAKYSRYFLGSIIICNRDGQRFIIDGQQRLTSLTLLLIYLHNLQLQLKLSEPVPVDTLIFSTAFGKKSFNLDIPERTPCIEALFKTGSYNLDDAKESNQNIIQRYSDIEENFPEALKEKALPYFIDWLKEQVILVEIMTDNDDDAYNIFETMNDRGLSLSPTDMLKGFLLTSITDEQARENAHALWKKRLAELLDLSEDGKEDEADFFKAWLRAQYATSIREGKKGAKPKDFDIIGTAFHKWIRDNKVLIGLNSGEDFRHFVLDQFQSFSERYLLLRKSAQDLTFAKKNGLEYVFYNAHNNFTLQFPLMLAPLRVEDDKETALRKFRLVAGYIDIFIIRRAVNFHKSDYSSIVYTMFNLMKEIRGKDIHSLVEIFKTKVSQMEESFEGFPYFRLNMWSKRYVHHILARITSYIEEQSGVDTNFYTYVSHDVKKSYEIEHIWGNQYSQHKDEFATEENFKDFRSKIGDLLLLQNGYNQSLSDQPYEYKVKAYAKQNLLARSLSEQGYQNEPSFLAFVKKSELPFHAYPTFTQKDLDDRQHLYQLICEQIWSPTRFDNELINE